MRLLQALAAVAVTGTLLGGVALAVTWAINPAGLIRWGAGMHVATTITPACTLLFMIPTLVMIMRRQRHAKAATPEVWKPGMPSDTGR